MAVLAVAVPPRPGVASTALTVTPLTWDVLGLDSDSPDTDGPDTFPVGARVCNPSGSVVTDVTTTFVLEAGADAAFALRTGVPALIELGDLEAGACLDS